MTGIRIVRLCCAFGLSDPQTRFLAELIFGEGRE